MQTAPRPQRRSAPQDVRITVFTNGEPRDVALSYPLDPDHDRLLRDIHSSGNAKGLIECRMHDDDPALRDLRSADGRLHGAWLEVAGWPNQPDRRLLKHWKNGIVTGSHAVPSIMTAEHRRRQEYIALRGDAAGYAVDLETSLARGTRSDVVIRGTETLAAEVQQSDIAMATVLRRTAKATAAGATVTWFADRQPAWAFRVPMAVTNERLGMDPGMWTVAMGPRFIEPEKCGPSARRPCPNGRNWCGRWHQFFEPMRGITVDHIVEMVPAGGLVRLDTGTKQGTVLTTPADRDSWLSEHPAVPPDTRSVVPKQRGEQGMTHSQYPAERLRNRIEQDDHQQAELQLPMKLIESPMHRPIPCPTCRHQSWDIRKGRCLACRVGAQ